MRFRRAIAVLAVVAAGFLPLPAAHAAVTMLTCDEPSIQQALDTGGDYALPGCDDLPISAPLVMNGGTVSIEGNNTTLDPKTASSHPTGDRRVFVVHGGTLTLDDFIMQDAAATYSLAAAPAPGTAGTDGTNGA